VEYQIACGTTQTTSYVSLPGARVVRAGTGAGTVYWVLTDHLGSSSVTVDASGNTIVGTARYEAYGATRASTGSMPTDKLFTGQRSEQTGLHFFNARWYDPYLNRWTQPDTIVPSPTDPQSFNRYSYSYNMPTIFTDPSGNRPCGDIYGDDCEDSPYEDDPNCLACQVPTGNNEVPWGTGQS
jgi:RHS repeat-associated protein